MRVDLHEVSEVVRGVWSQQRKRASHTLVTRVECCTACVRFIRQSLSICLSEFEMGIHRVKIALAVLWFGLGLIYESKVDVINMF
jgi:hypothetical protein